MKAATYEFEDAVKEAGYKYIAGVDEVGRGCLAGPVVAAAVHVPDKYMSNLVGKVRDSKKMTEKARERMYKKIMGCCNVGHAIVDNHYIDTYNILKASKLAMEFSLDQIVYDFVLVDGNFKLDNIKSEKQQCIVKGDSLSISIAAASIIAKVTRDRLMKKLHIEYPEFAWDRNKGYGTKEHIDALRKYGHTEYHRVSFKKVLPESA
jgi:ribonuclease HII